MMKAEHMDLEKYPKEDAYQNKPMVDKYVSLYD